MNGWPPRREAGVRHGSGSDWLTDAFEGNNCVGSCLFALTKQASVTHLLRSRKPVQPQVSGAVGNRTRVLRSDQITWLVYKAQPTGTFDERSTLGPETKGELMYGA